MVTEWRIAQLNSEQETSRNTGVHIEMGDLKSQSLESEHGGGASGDPPHERELDSLAREQDDRPLRSKRLGNFEHRYLSNEFIQWN